MSRRSKKQQRKKSAAPMPPVVPAPAPATKEPPGAPGRRKWEAPCICALLVVLIFIVFGQTLGFGFVNYDDNVNVSDTPAVVGGLSLRGTEWALTHAQVSRWAPLTTISRQLDCQLYGLWPGGHHLTNLLLHALAAVLLFLLVLEMTGSLWPSAFVAAVFAVHPLHVEPVAWISARGDLLCAIFFLLAAWSYLLYARKPERRVQYALSILWFSLGLMSKAMIVTLPFILLLLDYWPLGRLRQVSQFPRLLMEKLPFLALAAASCIETVIAQGALPGVERFSLAVRAANGLVAYAVYLWKMLCPVGLAVIYPLPREGWPAWQVAAAAAPLLAITAGALVLSRKRPYLLAGWLWYLGMLVPVIGILQIGDEARADRYTYLPVIGLCFAGALAAEDWTGARRLRRAVAGSAGALVLLVLMVIACKQTSYWRDSDTLWTRTLACTTGNLVARIDFGNALLREGNADAAAAQYQEALLIDPASAEAHLNFGSALLTQGHKAEAFAEYHEALRIEPDYAHAHINLGGALLDDGRNAEAAAQFREALRIDPDNADAHYDLGNALYQDGQRDAAIAEYREAMRLNPYNADIRENLAGTLLNAGHTEEAVAEYRDAAHMLPDSADAQYGLGSALAQQGQASEAIEHLRRAVELRPDDADYENSLAFLLATAPEPALRDAAGALELALKANRVSGGNNPVILRTLAAAYSETGSFSDAVQTARKALQLAGAQSNTALAGALSREVQLYAAGHPIDAGQ